MGLEQISYNISAGNYQAALGLVSSMNSHKILSMAYKSRIYELTGHFEMAFTVGSQAYDLAESIFEKIAASVALAYAHWRLLNLTSGHIVLNREKLPEQTESTEELKWIGNHHNIRGLLYWKNDELQEALKSFEKAKMLRQKLKNPTDYSYTLNNIGNTYLKKNDLEEAKSYFSQAKRIREQIGHKPGIAASFNSYGRLEDELGNHEIAKEHYEVSLQLWIEIDNKQFIGKAYRYLALNSLKLDNMEMAREYIEKSNYMFESIPNETDLKTNSKLFEKYL